MSDSSQWSWQHRLTRRRWIGYPTARSLMSGPEFVGSPHYLVEAGGSADDQRLAALTGH